MLKSEKRPRAEALFLIYDCSLLVYVLRANDQRRQRVDFNDWINDWRYTSLSFNDWTSTMGLGDLGATSVLERGP